MKIETLLWAYDLQQHEMYQADYGGDGNLKKLRKKVERTRKGIIRKFERLEKKNKHFKDIFLGRFGEIEDRFI